MKICVTAADTVLESAVDPRFGRCRHFIFFDTETGECVAQENPYAEFSGGAGIQSSQLMAARGVKAVLTGNVGPNAFRTLQAAGIEVYTGAAGLVKEAIEKYKAGELKKASAPGAAKSGLRAEERWNGTKRGGQGHGSGSQEKGSGCRARRRVPLPQLRKDPAAPGRSPLQFGELPLVRFRHDPGLSPHDHFRGER